MDKNISPTLAPKAKVAYRNAISMQNTCNMMLDIYEHENEDKKLQIGAYSISDIISCAIASSNELLNVAPIKLYFDKQSRTKKEVWIDRKKTEYMFRNILSNAYRHISFSGNVYIDIYTENIEDKEYCCCQIKDDGKNAISESATFMLSEEQAGYESTNQLKPELGLSLMRDNIIAHHGDIKIIKDAESGTSVIVYIPIGKDHFENDPNVKFVESEELQPIEIVSVEEKEKQQNKEEKELSSCIPTANTKHKILIIEDHKDIRLYMKILFSSKYSLIMAENGEEGIRMAQKEVPDIIISDVMMPGLNGFECTKILKEDIKTCHIPIILLTALVGDTNMVKGLELGADDYILKPFSPDVLLSKVKRLIKNRLELKQTYMKLMMANNTADANIEEEKKEDPFIRQIFDIVEKNLQNPDFNVKRLAEMLNMSQPTLYRRVKQLTSYTIIELIRGVRLKCAANLLRTRKYSIQEVSEMVGYNDTPTFRKHFVDFYGTTPSTFLNKEETKK